VDQVEPSGDAVVGVSVDRVRFRWVDGSTDGSDSSQWGEHHSQQKAEYDSRTDSWQGNPEAVKPEALRVMSALFEAMRVPASVRIDPRGQHKPPAFSAELRRAMEEAAKAHISFTLDRSFSSTAMVVMAGNVYPALMPGKSGDVCDYHATFTTVPMVLLADYAVGPGDRWTEEKRLTSDLAAFSLKLEYSHQGRETFSGRILERIALSGRTEYKLTDRSSAQLRPAASSPADRQETFQGELWFDAERGRLAEMSLTFENSTKTRSSGSWLEGASGSLRNTEFLWIREGASPEDACELLPSDASKRPTADELRVRYRKQYNEHFQAGRYAEAETAAMDLFSLDAEMFQRRAAVKNPMLTMGYTPSIREGLTPIETVIRAGEAVMLVADAQARQKHFTEAESSYSRALAGFRDVRGWWIPQVAECLMHQGRLYDQQKDFEQAANCYQRALTIRRALMNPRLGVGLRFRVEDSYLVIDRVLPGSAAARNPALQPGRQILEIAPDGGQRLECAEPEGNAAVATATELLRGPQGTKVKVVVDVEGTGDGSGPRTCVLTCDEPGEAGKPLGTASELVESLMEAAEFYTNHARPAEAEPLVSEAAPWLAGMTEFSGVRNVKLASQVALLLRARNQFDEAERLYEQTLAQSHSDRDGDPPQTARLLSDWAELCLLRGKPDEAVRLCRQALELREAKLGADHEETILNLEHLASMLCSREQWQEARPLLDRAWKGLQAMPGQHDRKARCLQLRAEMSWQAGQRDQAVTQLRESLAEAEKQRGLTAGAEVGRAALFAQFASGFERMTEWQLALGRPPEAHDAMERARARTLLDQLAWNGADLLTGSGQGDFSWEDLGEIAQRSSGNQGQQRFGSLQRYLAASGTLGKIHDLQEDERRFQWLYALSPTERRRQREELLTQIAVAQAELASDDAGDKYPQTRRRQLLESDLAILDLPASVRRELFFFYRDESVRLRNEAFRIWRAADRSDPSYWQGIARDWSPATLTSVQSWVTAHKALLLQYLVGAEGTFVLSVDPEGLVTLESLSVSEAQAKALGCAAGPLTNTTLRRLLLEEPRGIVRLMAGAGRASQATASLAELWKLIVPPAARARIEEGKAGLLAVIPDGPLSLLPFEALVVEPGEEPTYVLDVGPPVLYCHSATLLTTLSRRAEAEPRPGVEPVLSVADPLWPDPSEPPVGQVAPSVASPPVDVVRSAAQRLDRLPNANQESQWVAETLGDAGLAVEQLLREQATENTVRLRVAGRRIVHFACHGLADESRPNSAALVLTPAAPPSGLTTLTQQRFLSLLPDRAAALFGENNYGLPKSLLETLPEPGSDEAKGLPPIRPEDHDGLLMLPEICELNLHGCELAILSACSTNFGLEQSGEGVWALSRGFLAAGARRVVATDWVVRDRAAAKLVGTLAAVIAEAETAGRTVDLADGLHRAKLSVRQQQAWSSPHYWAAYVLIGPP